MEPEEVSAGSIVVGVDGSATSDAALAWAAEQAALERRGLAIVHALQPLGLTGAGAFGGTGIDYGTQMDALRNDADALLAAAAARVGSMFPEVRVHTVLCFGDPRVTLLDLSASSALAVVGSRGRGPLTSALLGSVSLAIAKHASCPVVVMRPSDPTTHGTRVAVAVDGTARSQPAVELAYRLASFRGMTLSVLHCYGEAPPPVAGAENGSSRPVGEVGDQRALVAESVAGMAEKFPDVPVEVALLRGHPVGLLIDAARTCDLLVLGHRHGSFLDTVVHGSVATEVLEHATCSVVVVPGTQP